jgi:1,4-alpha-glucan branching enzyme
MARVRISSIEYRDSEADEVLGVVQLDPWLGPFKDSLRKRFSLAQEWIKKIDETEGGLEKFSRVSQEKTVLGTGSNPNSRVTRNWAFMSSRITMLDIRNGHQMR